MTKRAQRVLEIYRGGNSEAIENLLALQKKEITYELRQFFGVSNNHDLAVLFSKSF